ncbi:MAG: hypothetical protein AAGA99_06650 [Actinomycetota bacterium]
MQRLTDVLAEPGLVLAVTSIAIGGGTALVTRVVGILLRSRDVDS